MNQAAAASLKLMLEGNERFRSGQSNHYRYPPELIREISAGGEPQAAVISCIDGRVAPEILFDQPLGSLFVSRVPGNTASDSAKWMLEIAVTDLHVPLLLVLGHTGCLAVGQVVKGQGGSGGSLRMDVARAVQTAKMSNPQDLFLESIKQNALQTTQILSNESLAVRQAIEAGRLDIVTGVYDVVSGSVELLDVKEPSFLG